jgi:hypothetical protein
MFPHILRTRRSKLTLAACLTAVTAASLTAILAAPDPIYARPAPLELGAASDPAGPWLNTTIARLRAQLAALPAIPPKPATTHTHVQLYSMDTTDRTTPVSIHDIHYFFAPDGSARARDVTLPETGAVSARTAHTPADGYETHPPGWHGNEFGTAHLSVDPAVLAGQLARNEPVSNGSYVLARAVGQAARLYCLSAAQRIAILTMLRDQVPDLVSRGTVTDRAGRRGTALTIESGNPQDPNQPTPRARDVLVFDDDGQLLAHELVAVDAPKALPHLAVPAVMSYTLILSATHPDAP